MGQRRQPIVAIAALVHRRHNAAFKAKVALEVIRGERTVDEVTSL